MSRQLKLFAHGSSLSALCTERFKLDLTFVSILEQIFTKKDEQTQNRNILAERNTEKAGLAESRVIYVNMCKESHLKV